MDGVDEMGGAEIAARTGAHNRDYARHHVRDNFIALGNVLVGEHVLDAIEDGYNHAPDAPFEERLMQALEAGRDAGGQHGGQRSAAILVYAARALKNLQPEKDDPRVGVGIVRRAILTPVKQIAENLFVSPKTIEAHRASLKEKLQLKSGADLVRFASQWTEER